MYQVLILTVVVCSLEVMISQDSRDYANLHRDSHWFWSLPPPKKAPFLFFVLCCIKLSKLGEQLMEANHLGKMLEVDFNWLLSWSIIHNGYIRLLIFQSDDL